MTNAGDVRRWRSFEGQADWRDQHYSTAYPMKTNIVLFAAVALLPAGAVLSWVWRTLQSAETAKKISARLQPTDFHIGNWPSAPSLDQS